MDFDKVMIAIFAGIIAVVISVGITVLLALPVMVLWNSVVPSIFGLKAISFTEALCLSVLCDLLFKSRTSSK